MNSFAFSFSNFLEIWLKFAIHLDGNPAIESQQANKVVNFFLQDTMQLDENNESVPDPSILTSFS